VSKAKRGIIGLVIWIVSLIIFLKYYTPPMMSGITKPWLETIKDNIPSWGFLGWSLVIGYIVLSSFEKVEKKEEEDDMVEPEELLDRTLERRALNIGLDPKNRVDRAMLKLIMEGKLTYGRVGLHEPEDPDKETRSKQRPKN
jgi:hypothetical protein